MGFEPRSPTTESQHATNELRCPLNKVIPGKNKIITVCLSGSTLTEREFLTVKFTSILSAPTVLFMMQTYTPESST